MTKTVSDLKKEYPYDRGSGETEPVKAVVTPLSVEKLKGGYNLLCSGDVKIVPSVASKRIHENLVAKLKEARGDSSKQASLVKYVPDRGR